VTIGGHVRHRTLSSFALVCAVALVASTAVAAGAGGKSRGQRTASLLFVLGASGGTFTARDGAAASVYDLALTDVAPDTVWFTDRPGRRADRVSTETALQMIGFGADNPPNAVVDARDAAPNEDAVAVELDAPSYDADARTLTFEATLLSKPGPRSRLAGFRSRVDPSIPESFGSVSLFVDDADTPVDRAGEPVVPDPDADIAKGEACGPKGGIPCPKPAGDGTHETPDAPDVNDDQWVTEVTVVASGSPSVGCPSGFVKDGHDLNEGAGGDYIYLCKRFGTDRSQTIGLPYVLITSPPDKPCATGGKIDLDLNRGAGGAFIYFCHTGRRGDAPGLPQQYVKDIAFDVYRTAPTAFNPPCSGFDPQFTTQTDFGPGEGWIRARVDDNSNYYPVVYGDLNEAAGGRFIYTCIYRVDA
jgi:hypothetical protein